MTTGRTRTRWLRQVLLAGLMSAAAGCATVDRTEDMRIESEVKARLVAEKDANLTQLGVLSTNSVVYLSGSVTSPDQRRRAETVAKDVRGVRRVVNTLDVSPAARCRQRRSISREPSRASPRSGGIIR